MDDTDENFSQTELQLLSQNNHLKQRIKEIEELYTAEDEKSYQEIQRLKSEIKELEEKIENLQTRIFDVENCSSPSSLLSHGASPSFSRVTSESEHNTSATANSSFTFSRHSNSDKSFSINPNFDDSLLEDYSNLQDSFQTLSDEKAEAVAEVNKLNEQLKTLQETIEDLIFKKNTREEYVQQLETAYNEVFQNYQELYKANGLLQKEIDDLKSCNRLNESHMSLFDELEEIKQRESLAHNELMLPEIIVIERSSEPANERSASEEYKAGELEITKKKRTSFVKKSLIRLFSALSICFDYLAIGVKHEFPILYIFSTDIVTLQARPRIPQV